MRNRKVKQSNGTNRVLSFFLYFVIFLMTFALSLGIIKYDYFEQLIRSQLNEDTFEEDAYQLFIRYMEHKDYENIGGRLRRDYIMIINTSKFKEYEQGRLGDFVVDFIDENDESFRCIFYFDRPLDQQCDW